MNNKNLFNRKDLKTFRSSLRNRSTSAEAALWEVLKSKKPEGDPHGEYHKIQEDEIRDKYLESFGFTVLRFENRFVFQEPEYLKSEIMKVFNKKTRSDLISQSTTPAATSLCNILTIIVLRPPLLQKEGKVL